MDVEMNRQPVQMTEQLLENGQNTTVRIVLDT